jgi:hypothetical protein
MPYIVTLFGTVCAKLALQAAARAVSVSARFIGSVSSVFVSLPILIQARATRRTMLRSANGGFP